MKRGEIIDYLTYCTLKIITFKYYRKDKKPHYFEKQAEVAKRKLGIKKKKKR